MSDRFVQITSYLGFTVFSGFYLFLCVYGTRSWADAVIFLVLGLIALCFTLIVFRVHYERVARERHLLPLR